MFELRRLKSEDMFTMFGILSKIGFKDLKELMTPDKVKEVTSLMKTDDKEVDADEATTFFGMTVIMDVVSIILKNLPSCKNEIYTLLSDLSGMKVKQIADLDMAEFTEMVIAVIQKEEFKDFFKVVSRLFK